QLKEVENQEIEKIVKQQIDVGLKAITDGEFRRAWWQFDYYFGLKGFKKIEKDTGFIFDGDETKAETVEVDGKIEWQGHEFMEHFKFLKEMVEKHGDGSQIPKMTIPAPFVSIYREISETEKEHYPTDEAFFKELGQSYKEALLAFYELCCFHIIDNHQNRKINFFIHLNHFLKTMVNLIKTLYSLFMKRVVVTFNLTILF